MHRKSKRIAVMAMALTLTATGISFNSGNFLFSKDNTITASAVQKIEVNAKKYGISSDSTSVDRVIIRNGDTVIKELDFATFTGEGYTLSANSGITVELVYGSSSTVYDAITGEVISKTGRTNPERDKVYIPVDLLLAQNNADIVDVYNTEYYQNRSFVKSASFSRDELYYNYKQKGIEYIETEYKNHSNSDIFIGIRNEGSATGSSTSLVKYNPFTMEFEGRDYITDNLNQGRIERLTVFTTESLRGKFSSCKSVEITINDHIDETFVPDDMNIGTFSDNNKRLVLTAKDLNSNADICTTMKSTEVRNMEIQDFCTVKVNYSDGMEEYKGLADSLFMIDTTRRNPPVTDENGNPVNDIFGNNVYPAVDDNGEGEGVISIKTLDFSNREDNCIMYLYCGCDLADSINYNEYITSGYKIENYNPAKNYYVKIEIADENEDVLWYKYNPALNAWIKTVDTRIQSEYEIKVNILNFPEAILYDDNSGIVTANKSADDKRTIFKIANGDINKGDKSFTVNGKDFCCINIGELYYWVMGTDVELSNDIKTVSVTIRNTDGKNHSYTVDGVLEENGKEVHFEFEDNGKDTVLRLPDGEYDIVRDDGYKSHIIIDRDNSENKEGSVGADGTYNNDDNEHKKGEQAELSFDPKGIHNFVVKSPDGKELFRGDVIDEGLDSAEDLRGRETPENKEKFDDVIVKYPYFTYEEKSGTVNSTNPDSIKTETGYLVSDSKGNLTKKSMTKGDVNLDGKLGISDLVVAQKYLLNNLDSKTIFTIDNFIALDICEDGAGDVFDMVALRKAVAEKVF